MQQPLTPASPASSWESARARGVYARALERNRSPALADLDHFVHATLPPLMRARSPPHITKPELSRLMAWKLLMGKARPGLQAYVDALDPEAVIAASSKAFAALTKTTPTSLSSAIVALSSPLKGVGPATATAVLAAFNPSLCAFCADEALEQFVGSRNYTVAEANALFLACKAKAEELNRAPSAGGGAGGTAGGGAAADSEFPLPGPWTANSVVLALWASSRAASTAAAAGAKRKRE